ncbi:MAG TPA: lactate utilization protein [Casimicrobiaceae bacterium]
MAIDDNRASRDAVLARVRAALGRRGGDDEARAAAQGYLAARRQGPRPALPADLPQHFLTRATDMESTVERVAAPDEVPPAVARYLASIAAALQVSSEGGRGGAAGAAQSGPGFPSGVCWPELATLGWTTAGMSVESRPTVGHDALGITGCFCAIAETGTLVFVSGIETPSGTFLLPETHVAIVRADQVVAGMEEAFARIRDAHGSLPRAVNLVSGPSRTGDIEQTIVLGAHGPRRLHIVLVG